MSANKYGLDSDYFRKNLEQLARDADNYTPSEMTRALRRLYVVAINQIPSPPNTQGEL